MSGLIGGVRTLILEKHPLCIWEGCVCHRLDLCIKHSVEGHPKMRKFLVVSKGMIAHFNRSSCAQATLKELRDIITEE
jgi:hypothetical protein